MSRNNRSPRWANAWDWIINVGYALILVIGFVGIFAAYQTGQSNHALTQRSITLSNAHHDQNARQQSEITALLKEHSVTFAKQKKAAAQQAAYDADVLAFAQTLAAELAAVCAATNANCPPIPTLAGS